MTLLKSLLLAAAAGMLAGCANTMLIPIAGGEKAEVTFGSKGPEMTSKEGFKIVRAGIELDAPAKAMNYVFDFTVAGGRAPRGVVVEDVTPDSEPEVLAEDISPSLANGHWHFVSPSKTADEPDLAWILTIEDSMRVYRFTVTNADGRKVVLYQPTSYTAPVKTAMRKALGLAY